MEENQNEKKQAKPNKFLEFMGIAFAVFLGAFLAFYFVIHQFLGAFFMPFGGVGFKDFDFDDFPPPDKMMRQEQRQEHNMMKEFDHDMNRDGLRLYKDKRFKISGIQSMKDEDGYKIVVDLKKFNNDVNNIKFNIDGQMVTISGNALKNKKNSENAYYFTESFQIPEKIDMDDIKKEKIGDNYVISLPVEE